MKMKITWIKEEKDNKNFMVAEKLGMDVHRLNNPEDVDKTMEELVKQKCNMIVLSNEIAGFSEDIIKKYKNSENINSIMGQRKEEE